MKLKGGYNLLVQGKPRGSIKVMPEPDILYLPLQSRRFVFSEICVKDGQHVSKGDILAKDPTLAKPEHATINTALRKHLNGGKGDIS